MPRKTMSHGNTTVDPNIKSSTTEQYIEAAILTMICIGAVVGNTCMWIIICKSKELRTVTNAFILGLTTADLLVSVLNMPVTIATLIIGEWPLSDSLCIFFGYLTMLTLVTSVLSLCNISVNRYVMVCKPIYYKTIYTKGRATIMMAACISLSALLSIPPLIGWAEYNYIPVQYFCFCQWEESLSYAFFMIGCCFGGPFSVMSICNFKIFRTVRASKRRIENNSHSNGQHGGEENSSTIITNRISQFKNDAKDHTFDTRTELSNINEVTVHLPTETTSSKLNTSDKEKVIAHKEPQKKLSITRRNTLHRGKKRTEEIRLAMALGIVVLVFFISWFPFCISMILTIFAPGQVPNRFHMVTLLIGYSNSGINPVIYGVMNKKFGDGFRKLFCFLCTHYYKHS